MVVHLLSPRGYVHIAIEGMQTCVCGAYRYWYTLDALERTERPATCGKCTRIFTKSQKYARLRMRRSTAS